MRPTPKTVRTTKEHPWTRLAREKSALRQVFDEPGLYEVRTPGGSTRQIFVVSRSPWRFAHVNREARRAEVQG